MKATKTAKTNSMITIGGKTKKDYFNECNNIEFHDLTAHDNLSSDMKTLMVFGLKFCM